MKPTFLTLGEVVTIHRDQIARYGGSEGVRDWGLLQSAIAMPTAKFGGQFLHPDLCEMAAAYLFDRRIPIPSWTATSVSQR